MTSATPPDPSGAADRAAPHETSTSVVASDGPFAALPETVAIVEVGPRDGLQGLSTFVPTDTKIALVDGLRSLGFAAVEATAFVHPEAVPQMSDAEAVMRGLDRDLPSPVMVLVPNAAGTERALACEPDILDFVVSASEAQNHANLNQDIAASLRELEASIERASAARVPLRLSISTAFGCPREGRVPPERVVRIARLAADLGVAEISLSDTTGMGHPRQVYALCAAVRDTLPDVRVAAHLHDTRGAGAANVLAAVLAGADTIDGSIGGLGGCPFAPGASGNVCTEDMVNMLHDIGVATGVDLDGLLDAAYRAEDALGVTFRGQVLRAGPAFG